MLNLLSRTIPQLINNQSDFDRPPTTTSTSTVPNDQLNKTIDVLLGSIQVLNDDTQQISSQALRTQCLLESITEDLSKLKTSVEETKAFAGGLQPNQEALRQDLASLNQEIEDQQAVSYDGTFVWRITDIQKKMGR